jgi:multiple sugar transport system ATP-binding protein
MGSPSMNLLTLPLVSEGAQLGETVVPLPRELLTEASEKNLKEVVFGVRPENLTLGAEGLPVTIDLVEELGADSFVHGHTPDGGRLVIRTDARVHPQSGSTVRATVTDNQHMHLFDPNSGQRFKHSSAVAADSSPVVSHDLPASLTLDK